MTWLEAGLLSPSCRTPDQTQGQALIRQAEEKEKAKPLDSRFRGNDIGGGDDEWGSSRE